MEPTRREADAAGGDGIVNAKNAVGPEFGEGRGELILQYRRFDDLEAAQTTAWHGQLDFDTAIACGFVRYQ